MRGDCSNKPSPGLRGNWLNGGQSSSARSTVWDPPPVGVLVEQMRDIAVGCGHGPLATYMVRLFTATQLVARPPIIGLDALRGNDTNRRPFAALAALMRDDTLTKWVGSLADTEFGHREHVPALRPRTSAATAHRRCRYRSRRSRRA